MESQKGFEHCSHAITCHDHQYTTTPFLSLCCFIFRYIYIFPCFSKVPLSFLMVPHTSQKISKNHWTPKGRRSTFGTFGDATLCRVVWLWGNWGRVARGVSDASLLQGFLRGCSTDDTRKVLSHAYTAQERELWSSNVERHIHREKASTSLEA